MLHEVFAGGAALYFLRSPAEVDVINDINGDLVNLYRVIKHHLEEFVRQFKWALSSRELFKGTEDTSPAMLTDIQRAARFFCLQNHCFGATARCRARPGGPRRRRQRSTFSGSRCNSAPPICAWAARSSNACTGMSALSATTYDRPHSFFYMDPRYWGTTEGYGGEFRFAEYEAVAEVMRQLKSKAMLSINERPASAGASTASTWKAGLDVSYTVGGGGQGLLIGVSG